MSSAYHPQSDGQTEAVNKCLEMYLRCVAGQHPSKWPQFLPWEEFWYNTEFYHSIGMTPIKAVYGRDPPTLLKYPLAATDPVPLQQLLTERDALLETPNLRLICSKRNNI